MTGYLDLAVQHLVEEEAELRRRLADAEARRDAYRECLQIALGVAHEYQRDLVKLKARHERLLDEHRTLRRVAA